MLQLSSLEELLELVVICESLRLPLSQYRRWLIRLFLLAWALQNYHVLHARGLTSVIVLSSHYFLKLVF